MEQTDRQTDKEDNLAFIRNQRSTWWEVTGFQQHTIDKLQDISSYPPCIKAIHGGMEIAPTTGTPHFQGAIQCHNQTRGSAINDWIPCTRIKPARSAEALRKYCMKSETSAGEKIVRTNTIKYYTADQICLLIGSKVIDADIMETIDQRVWFRRSVNILLRENVKLASQLMNPSLRNFWCDTARVWIDKSKETEAEAEEEP